jgi:DNA primase
MNLFSFIKQKVSILEVVGEYTTLKKAGLYHKGCCPFHHERTPSFTVSPHKEIFYCFGCHIGGDVISFIAKAENCSPIEATRHLIERYRLDVPQVVQNNDSKGTYEEKTRYHELCSFVSLWTHQQLALAKQAQGYLKERSVTPQSIQAFKLGYFPSGLTALKNFLEQGKKHSFLAQDFLTAHVLLEGKSGLYSPFEERILFPIKDHLGNVVGFGGRVFKPEDERAKYYNSHDHPFFNKGSLLFGLDTAKKSMHQIEAAFLVEGYMDALMMAQHGFLNTVATLGTACTLEHLKQLSRYVSRLYLLYDSDPAGQKAILRMLELCWQVNLDLLVVTLPSGYDPALYLAQGHDLQPLIDNAQDIFTFFIENTSTHFHTKSLQGKLQVSKKIIEVIGYLSDSLKQDLLLQKAASIFEIPFETLKQQLSLKHARSQGPPEPEEKPLITSKISQLEKKLFSVILYSKEELPPEDKELLQIWLPEPLKTWFQKRGASKTQDPLESFTQEEKALMSKLVIEGEDSTLDHPLDTLLLQFYKKQWKILVHNVKLRIRQAELRQDSKTIENLVAGLERLKKKMLLRGVHD